MNASTPGDPHEALRALAAHADSAVGHLAALPPPSARNAEERIAAATTHARARAARSAFMRHHGAWLYGQLTRGATVPLRLAELVNAAAAFAPALFATPQQWAEELSRPQADKEGWEIDQAVFLQGVLRDPRCGGHLVESMLRPMPQSLELLPSFRLTGEARCGPVQVARRGDVAHITVCNDRHLNAEDNELGLGMERCVDLALLDPQVRVAVVRGGVMTHPKYLGRRVFCSGINLKHLRDGRISLVDFLLGREFGYVNKIRHGLRGVQGACGEMAVEKPWVAAVDSFAIGGGLQLILAFDHVIASRDAYFVLPAAKEGIVPGSANLRLAARVGNRLARDMILRGRTLHAEEPDAASLADQVAPPAEMDAAIDAAAALLCSEAIPPNRKMLRLAEEPLDQFRAYMAEFALEQAERIHAPDVLARLGSWHAQA